MLVVILQIVRIFVSSSSIPHQNQLDEILNDVQCPSSGMESFRDPFLQERLVLHKLRSSLNLYRKLFFTCIVALLLQLEDNEHFIKPLTWFFIDGYLHIA